MKIPFTLFATSLVLALAPGMAMGAKTLPQKENMSGKFYASSVSGHVECIEDLRIFDLKKGDVVLGRGTRIRTFAGGNATLVFSNEVVLFVDEKSNLRINKFEQQPFMPNNNLVIEPSNSDTLITVEGGRVVVGTPQLLSGTRLYFETAHAHISILNGTPGGEKAFIEVTDKETHFALVTGAASIQVRDKDGNFVSIGTRLKSSEQAYVRYTLSGQITLSAAAEVAVNPGATPAAAAAPSDAAHAAATQSVFTSDSAAVTVPGEASILRVAGNATAQADSSSGQAALTVGMRLKQGAIITTPDDAEVYLQPFDGAIADIKPGSKVRIEKLATATANGVVQKQTALLDLKKGTLISMLDPDPAKRKIDNYGVRTPKGIATAHGTSFSVSVTDDDFSVAATADSVTFVTPSGKTYAISAGNVTVTSANGQVQAPIPLSQAVAEDPGMARVVRAAVSTISAVVQNNIGNLPSASAVNLISQVIGVADAAMPAQAVAFTSQVVTAVNSPGASTAASASVATASVTSAAVTAAPTQAANLAVASTRAAPSQSATIASAAASAAPSQSANVATAVLQTIAHDNAGGIAALTQTASNLAAAIAVSVPAQSASVAGALMQAIAQANPQATTAATTQAGATLAAAVSASVPAQSAPVAAAVMLSITQAATAPQTIALISQTAATLAAAVAVATPSQAVPVATALMQFVQQNDPAAGGAASGLITASVSQAAPGSGAAVTTAVAAASNQSESAVAQSAAQSAGQATATVAAASSAAASGSQSASSATSAGAAVATSAAAAASAAVAATTASSTTTASASGTGAVQSTSIIVEKLATNTIVGGDLTASASTVAFGTSTSSGSDNAGSTPTVTATPTTPNNLPVDTTVSTSVTPST